MELNTCDIADGMLMCGRADGGELPFLNQQSGDRSRLVSGPAYTVEFALTDDPRPAVAKHYIDSVPYGAIVLIAPTLAAQESEMPFSKIHQSLYGGLMSRRAKFLGSNGTVVLGNIRDIAEHEALNYPVFSYGTGCCAANKTAKVVNVNNVLNLRNGNKVCPGDIIYADANGVVVVPREVQGKVIEKAELRYEANAMTADDISNGSDAQSAQATRRKQFG